MSRDKVNPVNVQSLVTGVGFFACLALAQGASGVSVASSAGSKPAPEVTAAASAVSKISQYGITWTFEGKHASGQFANGDYWVIGPVRIIRIDPPSVEQIGTTTLTNFTLGGSNPKPRTMNGSMLNPMTGGTFGEAAKKINIHGRAMTLMCMFGLQRVGELILD